MSYKVREDHLRYTKDVIVVAVSQLLISLFGIITLPLLTKNYSVDLYGVWSQVSVTVGLLTPILTLHLGTGAVRFLSAENDNKVLSKAFSTMICVVLLVILTVITLSFITQFQLSEFLFKDAYYAYYAVLTFVWAGSSALFTFLISYLRSRGEITKLSNFRIFSALFKVIAIVILAVLNYSLTSIILSQILIEIIFSIAICVPIITKIGLSKPDNLILKDYLKLSLPDIPNGILIWVLNSSDRYLILRFLDLFQLGIYSASYTLGSLIFLFYAPISFVLFPNVSKLWIKGEFEEVKKYLEYSTKIFLIFSVPSVLGLYILSKPLLENLTPSQLLVSGELILLVALGTLFLGIYQINVYIIYLEKKTKFIPIITGASALLNILLNILLIPMIGITAAAISTFISYLVLAAIATIWAQKKVNYKINPIFVLKLVIASLIMMIFLNIWDITSSLQVVMAVAVGSLIYFICLLVLKTFSQTEIKLIRGILSHVKSQILK